MPKEKKLAKARGAAHKARTEKNRAQAKAEKARNETVELKRALRVIYTWAGMPGALDPDRVRQLAGRALGYAAEPAPIAD